MRGHSQLEFTKWNTPQIMVRMEYKKVKYIYDIVLQAVKL